MARSKRTNGTKNVKSSKRAQKQDTITTITTLLQTHRHLYLFQLQNARASFFQRLRRDLSATTVFFVGKNKVLQRALHDYAGDDDSKAALLHFARGITHDNGLIVSQLAQADLEDAIAVSMQEHDMRDYGRPGSLCPHDVHVDTDPTSKALRRQDTLEPVPATAEPVLRAAGLPTMLRGGMVVLADAVVSGWRVCEAGQRLTAEQAKVLRVFGVKTDDFNVRLHGHFAL